MSTPVFYFYGGEDIDFVASGGSFVSTAGGTFRTPWARCALVAYAQPGVQNSAFWSALQSFKTRAPSLWFASQCYTQFIGSNNQTDILRLCDGAVPRIRVEGPPFPAGGVCTVYKQNAAGVATVLGTIGSEWVAAGAPHRIDLQLVYSTSGLLNIYRDNVLIFTYSGDVTTDGATGLDGLQLGAPSYLNSSFNMYWSEVIVSDSDTRGMGGLLTEPPVANGNTHNFDVGSPAAANVNKISINDGTYDGATVAGLIDQYTGPSIPAGAWQVASFGVRARAEVGAFGGPSFAPGGRSGGTDFWGSPYPITTAWQNFPLQTWEIDPTTGAPWAALPVNLGLKAIS
jgi:hypothetical protein